jgi:predicted phosphodiesterase
MKDKKENNLNIIIIGDVHGKIKSYEKIIKENEDCAMSIQLGDFGFSNEHIYGTYQI